MNMNLGLACRSTTTAPPIHMQSGLIELQSDGQADFNPQPLLFLLPLLIFKQWHLRALSVRLQLFGHNLSTGQTKRIT